MVTVVLAGATSAFAQSGPAAAGAGFPKGAVEVGGIGGATLPVSWLRARQNRRIIMGSLDVGRVMTNQIGPGALAGQFEFLLACWAYVAATGRVTRRLRRCALR